jgi:hypothetical protein
MQIWGEMLAIKTAGAVLQPGEMTAEIVYPAMCDPE